jgi:hypothetical protein
LAFKRPQAELIDVNLRHETMQLHEQLEAVSDEVTFLKFVQTLAADRRANAETWGNGSIEEFLEASSSWAEDSEFGSSQGLSTASPWKKFDVFLYCGKIYE